MTEYKLLFVTTSSGEESIGTVIDETPEYYIFKKPRTFIKQPTSQGIGIAIVPFMLSASLTQKDSDVKVYKRHIVWTIDEKDIDQGLLNSYIQETTGLAVASSMPSKPSLLVTK